ncbi:arylsulfatase [Crateriforma conspicua]|uniref:arylsulfatase n=1 Tax=Crateriforma conspicua TaxID=2527996 RepID=UPI001188F762|nr:arylsulfatase [Crateriforma conspicua]QDV61629.1 Arylsulfatase precursor [Crateriforma conspicua]
MNRCHPIQGNLLIEARLPSLFRTFARSKFAFLAGLLLVSTPPCLADVGTRPNVVVILTDDQGWGDLSVHGNRNLSTPHIDSLARDGVTLEQFLVCSVCAPTRAEFLTGRYYPRTGVSGVSTGQERLNPDEFTIGELFQDAGYATGIFGKWHNGTQPPYHPNDQGFNEFYGFTSGHWGHYFSPPLEHNGTLVRGNGYVADDFTDHAIEFIRKHREQNFFCYLPFNTPHSPMMVDDRFYDKFEDAAIDPRHRDPQMEDLSMTRAALAMCENIDWNVGRLLSEIEGLHLSEQTIVVFFCDNGPNSYRFNGGMKGKKGSIDEGGVRSPCFIRWQGQIDGGTRIEHLTAALDLMPTLADLAGIDWQPPKPIDGKSLMPLIRRSQVTWPERTIFSIRGNQVSARTDRFRLDAKGHLFDLQEDLAQSTDVASRHPDLTARLKKQVAEFGKSMRQSFDANTDRPFTVGYRAKTRLPARDGTPHGSIRRSSKAPNNSFFVNWVDESDHIHWPIDVGQTGRYEAIVHYTCAPSNVGVRIGAAASDASTSALVSVAFDPPLYAKPKERVKESHYFVKDFRVLSLGTLNLTQGRTTLRLFASEPQGPGIIDVHSVELSRID